MRWASAVRAVLFLAAVVVAACSATAVSTDRRSIERQEYLAVWNYRLDTYRAQFSAKNKQVYERAKELSAAALERDKDPWPQFASMAAHVNSEVRDLFVIAGHAEALQSFLTHMASGPTPELTGKWFTRQGEDIEREAQELEAKGQQFAQSFDQRAREGLQWIDEMENLAKAQGMLVGRNSELSFLNFSVPGYFGVGIYDSSPIRGTYYTYLTEFSYQQQLLNTLHRPRTCTVLPNKVTCF